MAIGARGKAELIDTLLHTPYCEKFKTKPAILQKTQQLNSIPIQSPPKKKGANPDAMHPPESAYNMKYDRDVRSPRT